MRQEGELEKRKRERDESMRRNCGAGILPWHTHAPGLVPGLELAHMPEPVPELVLVLEPVPVPAVVLEPHRPSAEHSVLRSHP